MLRELVNLANHLDRKGFMKEADMLDDILKKQASKTPITMSMKADNDLVRTEGLDSSVLTVKILEKALKRMVIIDPSSNEIFTDVIRSGPDTFKSNLIGNGAFVLSLVSDQHKHIFEDKLIKLTDSVKNGGDRFDIKIDVSHLKEGIDSEDSGMTFRYYSSSSNDTYFLEVGDFSDQMIIDYAFRGNKSYVRSYISKSDFDCLKSCGADHDKAKICIYGEPPPAQSFQPTRRE